MSYQAWAKPLGSILPLQDEVLHRKYTTALSRQVSQYNLSRTFHPGGLYVLVQFIGADNLSQYTLSYPSAINPLRDNMS